MKTNIKFQTEFNKSNDNGLKLKVKEMEKKIDVNQTVIRKLKEISVSDFDSEDRNIAENLDKDIRIIL